MQKNCQIRRIIVKNSGGKVIFDAGVGDTWKDFTVVDINTIKSKPIVFDFDTEVLTNEMIEASTEIVTYRIKVEDPSSGTQFRISSHQTNESPAILVERNGTFVAHQEAGGQFEALCLATDFEVFF